MLTPKQQAIYDYIQERQEREGVCPSYREIMERFGFRSLTTVADHLRLLEAKGVVRRTPGRSRHLTLPGRAGAPPVARIPICGEIPAGPPSDGRQETGECLSIGLDAADIGAGKRHFALRVRGDSMIGAHILDGDIAVMEFRPPSPGNIVAALVDGQTTLKRYEVRQGRPYLKAENPRHKSLIPADELVIQGVLVALVRKGKF